MIPTLIFLLFVYLITMAWVLAGMLKLPVFTSRKFDKLNRFSMVVVFRNEADNLPRLLNSIRKLDYPQELFEIILINDASEDASKEIIDKHLSNTNLHYKIFQNKRYSQSPKKDAINLAVKQAQYDWILTTDADCKVPTNWLHYFNQFIEAKDPKMICAPVIFESDETLIKQFQFWDGLSLQAATMAGFGWHAPFLSNAANMGFHKEVFFEVNGYEGNNHLASGDDIFLMEKVKALYPNRIHYLKNPDGAVATLPVHSFQKLIGQRIRWASKTSKHKNLLAKFIGLIVFLTNLGFITALLACFIDPFQANYYALFLLLKLVADTCVLAMSANFFKKPILTAFLFPSNLSYPFVVAWVFLNSWNGSYEWKGRNFKK